MTYRQTRDPANLKSVINWEEDLISRRIKTSAQNNTWEPRDHPPKDFDGPLPEFIAERARHSSFSERSS